MDADSSYHAWDLIPLSQQGRGRKSDKAFTPHPAVALRCLMHADASYHAYKGTPITPAQYTIDRQKVAHTTAEHEAVPDGMLYGMRLQT